MSSPAIENADSDATEEACTANTPVASFTTVGNRFSLTFLYNKGSMRARSLT